MVTISEETTNKYFGNDNSIGKIISVNKRQNYSITRVYKTFHSNSHLKTDFLFSIQITPTHSQNWNGYL